MQRRVAVVGAGQTKFTARRADATFWELAHDAVKAAMQDAGLKDLDGVDSCVVGMFRYQYSYGRSSRFFRELKDNRRIMGTRCPNCGRVLCAPRADCRTCYVPTEWIEVAQTGTVLTYAVAQVNIDGTDSCILQIVRGIEPEQVHVGLRVKARFKAEREGRITDFEFVPL